MAYALALLTTAALAVGAVVLLMRVRQFTLRGLLPLVLAVVVTDVAISALTEPAPAGNTGDVVRAVLGWTYAGLALFSGNGAGLAADQVARGDIPIAVLAAARFFLQVFALLLTISAVVSAVARQSLDRMVVRTTRANEVFVVYSSGQDALVLARSLAKAPPEGQRRLVVLLTGADTAPRLRDELLRDGVRVLLDDSAVSAVARRVGVWHAVFFDDGEGGFVDDVSAKAAQLRALGCHPRLFVHVRSDAVRRDLASRLVGEDLQLVDPFDLTARDLVATAPPFRAVHLTRGRADRPFHALLVGDSRPLTTAVLQQLVKNSQFLGGTPQFSVVSCGEEHEGTFRAAHPGLDAACRIEWHRLDPGSPAFFELLNRGDWHAVVVALADATLGIALGHDIAAYFRMHQPAQPPPSLTVRADVAVTGGDGGLAVFGCRDRIFSARSLIDAAQDDRAKWVNAFYCGIRGGDPEYLEMREKLWADLPHLGRESSRASADFLDAMREVWATTASLPARERVELIARTEHLRWNAFYLTLGYRPMSPATMTERFARARAELPDAGPSRWGSFARDDQEHRQHVCLVEWEELPDVDAVYNALPGVVPRDFQQSDRDVLNLLHSELFVERPTSA